ncbi:unnamed protein product [Peronospora farinosa]|uniref:Uncharacterized protein n=1 Tax=Peronospora farinosa TaxID=134698 RepID=A0AAV0TI56_9STRA|nr:unnamed protein product [Peronospora farinosa]CAI5722355.1 unnamed protein product [Peronospora farinosa]
MQSSVLVAFAFLTSPVLCANVKVHHHPMKFREVTIIKDNAICPNGGTVLMCQSASYACQDDGTGTNKCLPRDNSFLDSINNKTRMPWTECDAKTSSKCLFDFECICMDYQNVNCYCQPPDAWRTERKIAKSCTTSSGIENTCDTGKYCRTKGSTQECAPAPYLPTTTSLYSDCSNDGKCDTGLTCKDYDNFAICVNNGETSR